ncbi:MAG: glycosyltransferase family 4 protein [Terracidiphilus sp.]
MGYFDNDKTAVAVDAVTSVASPNSKRKPATESQLEGKRTGMVVFSPYPADPRPRRAVEALLKEGMQIDLICEAEDGSRKHERFGQLEIIRVPIRHRREGAFSYAYQYSTFILISAAILAWRSLRRRYDLVYVHNMPDILVLSALLPKLLGAKVILDQHDPMPELMRTIFGKGETSAEVRMLYHLEKRSIAVADFVITVNVACKRLFSTRSCRAEKIGVVMNSPAEEIFPYREARSYPARSKGQQFIIMYHGSLVERSGLELAIDALYKVQGNVPQAELRVYGRSTPYLERAMSKAHALDLGDRVRYMGPRRLEDLASEIERCDLGIIPNLRNTFTEINTPTRIFEYLALGKPVIAPSTLGIRDYFSPDSLIFFEAGDSDDLAMKIEFVAWHPDEAITVTERGQRVYLAHTWREERTIFINLVTKLIAG